MLRVELEDWDGNYAYADYNNFRISEEAQNYKLLFESFNGGNAGDSMDYQNNRAFSTWDQDNDSNISRHCAQVFSGAWWYRDCHLSNLNGFYYNSDGQNYRGMQWSTWGGRKTNKRTTMTIEVV